MATDAIVKNFQPQFENIWRRLAQQQNSRLSKAVDFKTGCTGEVEYADQIKPIDPTEITARLQPTAIDEIDTEVRAIYPRRFNSVKHFDEFDEHFLADQSVPQSPTFNEFNAGLMRTMDDLIIEAALGTAKTGKGGGTDVALPAGQIIAADRGTGTAENMTLQKWLDVKQLMEQNEVIGQDAEAAGDKAYIVLGSAQLRSLYNETQITSSDYAKDMAALYYGEIDQFLGFKVIRSERLALATDIRSCFAFVTSGIAMRVWHNPSFKAVIRDDYNDALQLRGKAVYGASRLEEVKVVQIECDESVV